MRPALPAAMLALSLLAGCRSDLTVRVVQDRQAVRLLVAAPSDACPQDVRVTPEATPSSPAWYVTAERRDRCVTQFVYGETPPGWRVVVPPEPLAAGTAYSVAIDMPGASGVERFTRSR